MNEVVERDEPFCENSVQKILEDSVTLEDNERTSFIPKEPSFHCVSEITENLLLTSATGANVNNLRLFGVTCVINVTVELPDTPLNNNSTGYFRISLYDNASSNIISCFELVLGVMNEEISKGGKVLLHCVAGISRSATICIAYLMKHRAFNLLEAYNYTKLKRPIIKPNCGFFRQLIQYENVLYGTSSVSMVYNDMVKMEIPDVYDVDYKNIISYRRKRKDLVRRH